MVEISIRQIVKDLMKQTRSGEISWKADISSTDYKSIFKYYKKITDKKYLIFSLTAKRDRYQSDLTIIYGAKGDEKLVSIITTKSQPLIYQLVELLIGMFDRGEIKYLKEKLMSESWGGMKLRDSDKISSTERDPFFRPVSVGPREPEPEPQSSEKLKNLKLINLLVQHTEEGKLSWEDTFHDENSATFISNFNITKSKKLTFSVRTEMKSKDKDENILRILLKVQVGGSNKSTSVIRALRIMDYPQLTELFKYLNKKYLDRVYESPHKSKAIIATTVEEYRFEILNVVKQFIRDMPVGDQYKSRTEELWHIFERMKKAESMDNINALLWRAKQLSDTTSPNPIGSPWWEG